MIIGGFVFSDLYLGSKREQMRKHSNYVSESEEEFNSPTSAEESSGDEEWIEPTPKRSKSATARKNTKTKSELRKPAATTETTTQTRKPLSSTFAVGQRVLSLLDGEAGTIVSLPEDDGYFEVRQDCIDYDDDALTFEFYLAEDMTALGASSSSFGAASSSSARSPTKAAVQGKQSLATIKKLAVFAARSKSIPLKTGRLAIQNNSQLIELSGIKKESVDFATHRDGVIGRATFTYSDEQYIDTIDVEGQRFKATQDPPRIPCATFAVVNIQEKSIKATNGAAKSIQCTAVVENVFHDFTGPSLT